MYEHVYTTPHTHTLKRKLTRTCTFPLTCTYTGTDPCGHDLAN